MHAALIQPTTGGEPSGLMCIAATVLATDDEEPAGLRKTDGFSASSSCDISHYRIMTMIVVPDVPPYPPVRMHPPLGYPPYPP